MAPNRPMNIALVALAFLPLISTAAGQSADTNTYSNPALGISVTKPKDWVFVSAEQHAESLKRAKLKDEEFLKLVQKYSSAPLVTMTKYAEPFDDLNPSFKLSVKLLGKLSGDDPKAILSLITAPLKDKFDDFKTVVSPQETTVAKHKAAYTQIHFNLQNADGRRFPTCSELWVVPRGKHFILIGCGTRQDEQTGKRAELEKILSSLKLE